LLKQFANNEYENHVYVNFEDSSTISEALKEDLGAERIIEYLGILSGKTIRPGKTLIIFDEIQSSPQTLKSLKYFNEKLNEYHIVAAGSLLGVALAGTKSFPVEIKAGINLRAKSLKIYDEKYNPSRLFRCSLGNFNISRKSIDIPLYAVERFKSALKTKVASQPSAGIQYVLRYTVDATA